MKSDYVMFAEADKKLCKGLLSKYHYLSKIGNGFKSGYNFILWNTKRGGKLASRDSATGLE